METEAKANSRRCFLGENGGPLRLCSRRIDKGRPGQYNIVNVLHGKVSDVVFNSILSYIAQWFKSVKKF